MNSESNSIGCDGGCVAIVNSWSIVQLSTACPKLTSSLEAGRSRSPARTTFSRWHKWDSPSAYPDSWAWTFPWDPGGSLVMYLLASFTQSSTWVTPELDSPMPCKTELISQYKTGRPQ